MMDRLRESKWVYILCSIALALLFWMYVRVTVDPTDTQTIRNVRVVQTGTSVLTSQGLTVAEIELDDENEEFPRPDWLGTEVTGDRRYYNSMLTANPYSVWKD